VSWRITDIEGITEVVELENIKALVSSIRERRAVIEKHTLQYDPYDLSASLDSIYREAQAMQGELDRLHELLTLFWGEIVRVTTGRVLDLGLTEEQAREMEERIKKELSKKG
jgi:hypothetical protein